MKKSYIIIGVVVIVMLVAIGIYAVINSNFSKQKTIGRKFNKYRRNN